MSVSLQWMSGTRAVSPKAGLYDGTALFGTASPGTLIINSNGAFLGNVITDPLVGGYGGYLSGDVYQPTATTCGFTASCFTNTFSMATGYGSTLGGSFSGSFSGSTFSGTGTSTSTPVQTGMTSFSLIYSFRFIGEGPVGLIHLRG